MSQQHKGEEQKLWYAGGRRQPLEEAAHTQEGLSSGHPLWNDAGDNNSL